MTWLYAEYTNYLTNRDGENDLVALENYNLCIELILTILTQQKCLTMMSQIIKQAPMLTSRCFSVRVDSFILVVFRTKIQTHFSHKRAL